MARNALGFEREKPTGEGTAPLRLVIFDVDGTLVDSQNHIVEAQHCAFAALGLPPPSRRETLAVVGLSLPEAFAALVGAEGPVLALSEAYKEAWTVLRGRADFAEVLYPGARETIAALAADPEVLLGIATGKSRKGVDRLLAAQGWEGQFATLHTADEHPSKPDPSMIVTALRETGVPADAAVMVGDTTFDMEMARAAGIRAIGVAWGYHEPSALTHCGAECVAADFSALRTILKPATSKVAPAPAS